MARKSIPKIEIRKAGNDEYYFVFRLPHDGIFISIFFDRMSEVVDAIEYSQRISTDDKRYTCKAKSTDDEYFVFLTKSNKPIGQSIIINHTATMNIGLQYMQKHLHRAEDVDLTK